MELNEYLIIQERYIEQNFRKGLSGGGWVRVGSTVQDSGNLPP
jgi:hypothetical protein